MEPKIYQVLDFTNFRMVLKLAQDQGKMGDYPIVEEIETGIRKAFGLPPEENLVLSTNREIPPYLKPKMDELRTLCQQAIGMLGIYERLAEKIEIGS